ncbi:unnamed protein product [Effrenium voratum]|nr:unnamed protein product [Effrenium voratum]
MAESPEGIRLDARVRSPGYFLPCLGSTRESFCAQDCAPAPKSYPATSHIEEGALLPTGEALESLIQQVSMNTALLRSLLPMLSNVSARTSLMGPQADLLTALVYASSTLPPPMPQQDSFAAALTTQGDMEFFEYVPNSLEVFVGQMVELWPPVNQMRGCVYAVAPQLPRGVALDERSGLLHGRPQERTPGQMTYFITAWSPTRTPPVVSVALVKLMVNHVTLGLGDPKRFGPRMR